MPDTSAAVQRLFDAMNAHDLDAVAAAAAENVEFVDVATGEEIHNRAEWRQYCGRYLKAFPDMHLEQTNLVAEGDQAFVEAVAHGTNDGPLESPDGEIPPTGKTIAVKFSMVFRVRDGQIADSREYYDGMTLMTQLGLVPPPA